jgi:hypothetical protein
MDLSPEVLASIINIAGTWSLKIADTRHPSENPLGDRFPQSSEISRELVNHFNWAFSYLEGYMQEYASKSR